MIAGLKIHWSPIDAVIAAGTGFFGVYLVHLAHPHLHVLAYAAGWLIVAAIMYQTGSEFSARRREKAGSAN